MISRYLAGTVIFTMDGGEECERYAMTPDFTYDRTGQYFQNPELALSALHTLGFLQAVICAKRLEIKDLIDRYRAF